MAGILCLPCIGILSLSHLPQLSSPLTKLPICHYTAFVGSKPLHLSPELSYAQTDEERESTWAKQGPGQAGTGSRLRDALGGRTLPAANVHSQGQFFSRQRMKTHTGEKAQCTFSHTSLSLDFECNRGGGSRWDFSL